MNKIKMSRNKDEILKISKEKRNNFKNNTLDMLSHKKVKFKEPNTSKFTAVRFTGKANRNINNINENHIQTNTNIIKPSEINIEHSFYNTNEPNFYSLDGTKSQDLKSNYTNGSKEKVSQREIRRKRMYKLNGSRENPLRFKNIMSKSLKQQIFRESLLVHSIKVGRLKLSSSKDRLQERITYRSTTKERLHENLSSSSTKERLQESLSSSNPKERLQESLSGSTSKERLQESLSSNSLKERLQERLTNKSTKKEILKNPLKFQNYNSLKWKKQILKDNIRIPNIKEKKLKLNTSSQRQQQKLNAKLSDKTNIFKDSTKNIKTYKVKNIKISNVRKPIKKEDRTNNVNRNTIFQSHNIKNLKITNGLNKIIDTTKKPTNTTFIEFKNNKELITPKKKLESSTTRTEINNNFKLLFKNKAQKESFNKHFENESKKRELLKPKSKFEKLKSIDKNGKRFNQSPLLKALIFSATNNLLKENSDTTDLGANSLKRTIKNVRTTKATYKVAKKSAHTIKGAVKNTVELIKILVKAITSAISSIVSSVGLPLLLVSVAIISIIASIFGANGTAVLPTFCVMCEDDFRQSFSQYVDQLNGEVQQKIDSIISGTPHDDLVQTGSFKDVRYEYLLCLYTVIHQQDFSASEEEWQSEIKNIHGMCYKISSHTETYTVEETHETSSTDADGNVTHDTETRIVTKIRFFVDIENYDFYTVATNVLNNDDESFGWFLALLEGEEVNANGGGAGVPLTQSQVQDLISSLNITDQRGKELIQKALECLGYTSYELGAKPTGNTVPSKADCSGFIAWVYSQALSDNRLMGGGTTYQWGVTNQISMSDLKVGDICFWKTPQQASTYNHVGIYIGKDEATGHNLYIHCQGGTGVVISDFNFQYYRRLP